MLTRLGAKCHDVTKVCTKSSERGRELLSTKEPLWLLALHPYKCNAVHAEFSCVFAYLLHYNPDENGYLDTLENQVSNCWWRRLKNALFLVWTGETQPVSNSQVLVYG